MASACDSKCNSCDGACNSSCYSGNSCSSCNSNVCNNQCNYCNSCNSGCDTSCNNRCYNCQVCNSACNLDQTCKSCNICNSSCHNWYTDHFNKTNCQGYDAGEAKLICYDVMPKSWAQCHNQDPCAGSHGCGSNAYGCISNSPIYSNKYYCNNS